VYHVFSALGMQHSIEHTARQRKPGRAGDSEHRGASGRSRRTVGDLKVVGSEGHAKGVIVGGDGDNTRISCYKGIVSSVVWGRMILNRSASSTASFKVLNKTKID